MNAAQFYRPMPRILINTAFNPGSLFDGGNTYLEWNHDNGGINLVNGANLLSTAICTGLRIYAESTKQVLNENGKIITEPYNGPTLSIKNPSFSTAGAGFTQLIVALTYLGHGHLYDALLPGFFGIGDMCAAFNKDAKPDTGEATKKDRTNTLTSSCIDVAVTAEIWFASGLSMHGAPMPDVLFVAAATFATARNVPFLSQQLNRLRKVGQQLKRPITTFGALALGCVGVACNNSNLLHVLLPYIGFGVAYLGIPTFKSGGLYEAVRNHFMRRSADIAPKS